MTNSRRFETWVLKCLPLKLRLRLQRASVENRAIMQGMLWVSIFLVLAKAIAAGKEVIIAYRYGTSAVVDGYLFVFNLAQWPSSIFASVTGIILIPYLVKLQTEKPAQATQLQSALVTFAIMLGIVASTLYGVIIWWLVRWFDFGLTAQSQTAALTALPWVASGIAFTFVATVLSNWLMSQRRHTNTLLEAMPAAVIGICLLIWPVTSGQTWNVLPLAVGTFLGFFLQTLLLSKINHQRFNFTSINVLSQHWPAWRSAFGLMLLAQVVMTSTGLLDQFFAVRMGEGVLASYSYAQRIMALVLGLTSVVVARAMLPVFSSVRDEQISFNMATRWACRLAGLGVLLTLALVFIANFLVMLLFQRGAFTETDTHHVAQVLELLGLQLPFYLFGIVMVQWLGATSKSFWLLIAAIGGFIAKLLAALWWFDHGAMGLAASTAVMYCVSSIIIYGIAHISLKLQTKSQ